MNKTTFTAEDKSAAKKFVKNCAEELGSHLSDASIPDALKISILKDISSLVNEARRRSSTAGVFLGTPALSLPPRFRQ